MEAFVNSKTRLVDVSIQSGFITDATRGIILRTSVLDNLPDCYNVVCNDIRSCPARYPQFEDVRRRLEDFDKANLGARQETQRVLVAQEADQKRISKLEKELALFQKGVVIESL